jgi:hypothetical protein
VAAEAIARNLAFINWTLLTSIAVGAYLAVVLARRQTAATRGYLGFMAFAAATVGILAWLSDGALAIDSGRLVGTIQPFPLDPAFDAPRRAALGLFCLLAVFEVVAIARRRAWQVVEVGGAAVGIAVLALAALAWGGGVVGVVALFAQLAILSVVTGGVFAAMVLGHWYLVTPKLPERALILFARILTIAIALQLALFIAWTGLGGGPHGSPGFGALTGEWALFVWLRLIVGLVFPLIVSWAAIQTARTRSMESATGLLYINVGTIASGTILAAGLYFGAGLLV